MKFQPLRTGVLVEPEITEEKKTKSGLIIAHSIFDSYDRTKSTSSFGKIVSRGTFCEYLKEGDRVVYAKNSQWSDVMDGEKKRLFFKEEKNILARINPDGSYDIHPNFCIVKISKQDRDGLFSKIITRNDGTQVELFINVPADAADERSSKFFVSTGTVTQVGRNVTGVEIGDIGLLDYNLDNDENVVIGYEGDDKLIIVNSVTTRHEEDEIVYANRRTARDTKVSVKGDYDLISQLLGVVHDDKLIAIDPFVFVNHMSNIIQMKTKAGIVYEHTQRIIEREVLATSENSSKMFNIKEGQTIIINELDIFDVTFSGKKVSCINDLDIMVAKN